MTQAYHLRPYQNSAVEAALNFIKYRAAHGYVVAPGGSGKSVMIARVAEICASWNLRVVVLATNEKLLTQNRAKLTDQTLAGIYCAGLGEKDASKPITIASIQSIANMENPPHFDIALVDECDLVPDDNEGQFWEFFARCGNPRIVGFTATPFRLDSGALKWGQEIITIPILPLVQDGHIIPPNNKVGPSPDLSSVNVKMGEYNQAQLDALYDDQELLLSSLVKLIQYGQHRKHVLVFTQSLKHSDALAAILEHNGHSCRTVDGDTDKDELRDEIIPAFEAGEFKYLINCNLLTVGVDIPCIDMIAVIRSTLSKRLFEQMVYRGTRPCGDKQNFLLLDMGGNLMEHGALGSPYRGKDGKGGSREAPGRICPECETFCKITDKQCGDCGYVFPEIEARKVNHSTDADVTSHAIYTGDLMTYEVESVRYSKHVNKKNGNESLRVDYFCSYGKYGNISEWLSCKHPNEWARGKAYEFFRARGNTLEKPIEEHTWEELIFEASKLKRPTTIMVNHAEQFPRVVQYGWGEVEKPIEIDLEDEIVF